MMLHGVNTFADALPTRCARQPIVGSPVCVSYEAGSGLAEDILHGSQDSPQDAMQAEGAPPEALHKSLLPERAASCPTLVSTGPRGSSAFSEATHWSSPLHDERNVGIGSLTRLPRAASMMLSQVGNVGLARTFRCPICLENAREQDRVVFAECGTTEHGCCRECITLYVRGLVLDGRVNSIACPQSRQCGASASPDEVRQLTDDATHQKYERFRKMRQDPMLRECPGCRVLCKAVVGDEGSVVCDMRCEACGAEFCYYHSNAHIGRSCEDYRREAAKDERAAEASARRGTKPCPGCGIATHKISGCNHMTCAGCQRNWCWACGESIESVAWHYNPGNISGCQQFQDNNSVETNGHLFKFLRCLMAPISLLSLVIFAVLSLLFVVSLPLSMCVVGPCVKYEMGKICTFAAMLTYAPFVVFQAAWFVVAAGLGCVLCPCGARREHFAFLMQVPFASVMSVVEGVH